MNQRVSHTVDVSRFNVNMGTKREFLKKLVNAGVIGGVVGGLSTTILSQHLQNKSQRQTVRAALHSEINSMRWNVWIWRKTVFPKNDRFEGAPVLASNPFSKTVYEGNAGEIGQLNEEESTRVSEFYSMVTWYNRVLERLYSGEDLQGNLILVLLGKIPALELHLKFALQKLEENSDNMEPQERRHPSQALLDNADSIAQEYDLSKVEMFSPRQDLEIEN